MENIYPDFKHIVTRLEKENRLQQKAKVIWFTGLSGSGKTTLATGLERVLFEKGFIIQLLDGDNIRSGINNNLGFTDEDRIENVRRIAEIANLLLNCGIISICSFVSPTEKIRETVREIVGKADFLEIYLNTPLEVCEDRDVKGLYAKARSGELHNFTGVSAPFEASKKSILKIDTSNKSVEECLDLLQKKILPEITSAE